MEEKMDGWMDRGLFFFCFLLFRLIIVYQLFLLFCFVVYTLYTYFYCIDYDYEY